MFLKKGPKERSRAGNASHAIPVFASILFLLGCSALLAADKVKDLQDHFDHDPHADSKVKTLDKLSLAQFEAASKAGAAGDYSTVGFIFEKYRDNVRAVFELLKKQQPDADRHTNPYRQLELQVRRGIREVEETMIVAPDPVRPPLEIVRQDLISTDDELIHLLFPRRTKDPERVPSPPEAKP
jgi:hypothetical protein